MARRKQHATRPPWGYPADLDAMPAEDMTIHFATWCSCGWRRDSLTSMSEARRLTEEHQKETGHA